MGGTASVGVAYTIVDKLTGGRISAEVGRVKNKLFPKPDAPPDAPNPTDPAKDMQAAADRQRKKNAAAYGRSDTILTSPQGVLGSSPTVGGKTLLGG